MIKDRLAALKSAQQTGDDDKGVAQEETTVSMTRSSTAFMFEFFVQVDDLRTNIDKIAELVADVKILHNEILSSPQADQRTKGLLEDKMAEIKRSANEVRRKLKEINDEVNHRDHYDNIDILSSRRNIPETEPLITNHDSKLSDYISQTVGQIDPQDGSTHQYIPASERMKKTQLVTLKIRFNDIIADFNTEQVNYRENCKMQLQRQLHITGRTTTSEELEEMLESGNPAIFTKGIVVEAQDARRTLAEIEARHNDIIKLEASIRELHDMFIDMAMLVESQGEMIDRIEYNVNQSVNYIDSAKADTRKAVKYQSSARKKKIIISVVVIVLVIILVLVLATVFRK